MAARWVENRPTARVSVSRVSLVKISRALSKQVDGLQFGAPVTHVYNPLSYARRSHETYLERYGVNPVKVLLLGMNPGPFGMAQTGVPFGDVGMVRDWLGITAAVRRPEGEHPKRPVLGFECTRAEVSGSRLWGLARQRFGTPERFFQHFFVANYCPLVFLEASGRNRTPDKLSADERAPLFEACDAALRKTALALQPRFLVGVGAFATRRAKASLADSGIEVVSILHPSPASPLANQGWAQRIEKQLFEYGILE